jgi:[amino group carrier protein]-lysine/ornithine hydrolase
MDEKELLVGLVKIYSPTYQESTAVEYLVDQMGRAGFTVFIDEAGNAVGTRGRGPNEILLLGHIDTVPGWIDVRTEGDSLYGRGTVDAKGPLATFVAAAARVEPPSGWQLTVIGAVGEESDGRGAFYLRGRRPPKALVIGEPSKWDHITLGFKGNLWAEYTLRRPQTHTASQTQSACEGAIGFWTRVQDLCEGRNLGKAGIFERLTPNLRAMQSETNGLTDTARLTVGLRLPLGISLEEVTASLDRIKEDGNLAFQPRAVEAYRSEKNTPLVRAFLQAVRQAGGEPAFSVKSGTSDLNVVAPAWCCQAVAYGPGDSNLDHTPNEHVSLIEYALSIQVLAQVLKTIMK